MASVTCASGLAAPVSCSFQRNAAPVRAANLRMQFFGGRGFSSASLKQPPSRNHLMITCVAKPATVDKVCEIVKKQLALAAEKEVIGGSKFQELGADSLDTVEIMMGLEEAFGISVEEESAQKIATIQDAADLIEDLVQQKDGR